MCLTNHRLNESDFIFNFTENITTSKSYTRLVSDS